MSEATKIEWTDCTFNPWWGCARVSPACRSCYADGIASRWGHQLWRRHGPRRMLSEANWQNPLRWNRAAKNAGEPAKVFCASMADVFEIHPVAEINAQLDAARLRLWALIEQTPWLIWQLLTKRPENVAALAPWTNTWPPNVWLGTSVEDNQRAWQRIPDLVRINAHTRFLSCEPLLKAVDLTPWMPPGFATWRCSGCHRFYTGPHRDTCPGCGRVGYWSGSHTGNGRPNGQPIGWVVIGGESRQRNHPPRPTAAAWLGRIRDDCVAAGVPLFVKQAGHVLAAEWGMTGTGHQLHELPAAFQIRQYPTITAPKDPERVM